jgi:hypothetical protein
VTVEGVPDGALWGLSRKFASQVYEIPSKTGNNDSQPKIDGLQQNRDILTPPTDSTVLTLFLLS